MFDKYNYLYVEDDPLSREIMLVTMTQILQTNNITIFEDSNDFLERLTKLNPHPDVFMLDIHVEPLSGFEMLKFIREHDDYQDVIAIAITASVTNNEVKKIETAGFNGAIGKPIDVTQFKSLMTQILNGESVWYTS